MTYFLPRKDLEKFKFTIKQTQNVLIIALNKPYEHDIVLWLSCAGPNPYTLSFFFHTTCTCLGNIVIKVGTLGIFLRVLAS